MVSPDFSELFEELKDSELFRYAVHYLQLAYMEAANQSSENPEDALDQIYMECARRGKEWIFDRAQESFLKQSLYCPVTEQPSAM